MTSLRLMASLQVNTNLMEISLCFTARMPKETLELRINLKVWENCLLRKIWMNKWRIFRVNGNNRMSNWPVGLNRDIITHCQRDSLQAFRMRWRSLMLRLKIWETFWSRRLGKCRRGRIQWSWARRLILHNQDSLRLKMSLQSNSTSKLRH